MYRDRVLIGHTFKGVYWFWFITCIVNLYSAAAATADALHVVLVAIIM